MLYLNCLIAVFLAILCAGFLIPQILLISYRRKLFDEVNERKIHHASIPRLGGVAFQPVIFFVTVLLAGVNLAYGNIDLTNLNSNQVCSALFSSCSVSLIYLVGLADDLIGIRYRAKFVAQILASLLIIAGGITLHDFHGALCLWQTPQWFSALFSIVLIVFITNSFNLIDGIDGLASGLGAIACLTYGFVFLLNNNFLFAVISFASFGVLVPFYIFNVFGNPEKHKKIFMGDSGALTIGTILTFLSLRITEYPAIESLRNVNVMVLAFSPLFIPCCDVVRVYLQRLINGKNPFLPDKTHIHHKLMDAGLSQKSSMVTIIIISLCLTIANILISPYLDINFIFLSDIIVWIFLNIFLNRAMRKHRAAQV